MLQVVLAHMCTGTRVFQGVKKKREVFLAIACDEVIMLNSLYSTVYLD